ncbi:hypothetical protein KY284_029001 [Solanum tuberosum]|nr:hypothetical protein KY284_029001 [Solanum tuberosum]
MVLLLDNCGTNSDNTWLRSTTRDQGILNQTMQQESEKSASSVPLVPTNNAPSDDVPEECVTYEENNTNILIDDTRPMVSSDDNMTRYQLPPRINRGKAPARYSHDNPKEVKYHIAHYVSIGHLPSSIQGFENQMSSVISPTRFEEALDDPKWAESTNEKM